MSKSVILSLKLLLQVLLKNGRSVAKCDPYILRVTHSSHGSWSGGWPMNFVKICKYGHYRNTSVFPQYSFKDAPMTIGWNVTILSRGDELRNKDMIDAMHLETILSVSRCSHSIKKHQWHTDSSYLGKIAPTPWEDKITFKGSDTGDGHLYDYLSFKSYFGLILPSKDRHKNYRHNW